ncbi:MAG: nucleotide exchange factor GrpE [Chloroflexi bacterium]|nr:nucleotide exchange factor GrpE [Chloroflexota bacterium]
MSEEQVKELEEKHPEAVEDAASLKKQLEDERAKSAEYLDQWQRARADLSNFRKRADKEREDFGKFANSVLIARLLPVLDDFDRAFQTIPDNLRELTWIQGVMLIARKMNAVLEAEGLKPIDALNQPFDPNVHEAVIHEETDQHDDGVVIAELQKGFKLNDRVIRPTMVKVAKKKN